MRSSASCPSRATCTSSPERAKKGASPIQHLTELTVDQFEKAYRDVVPETMVGSEFLAEFKSHDDPITEIQPEGMYWDAQYTQSMAL